MTNTGDGIARFTLLAAIFAAGCTGSTGPAGLDAEPGAKGDPGADGAAGAPGLSCTVTDDGDGTNTIACEDGTTATVRDGAAGDRGLSCSVTSDGTGTKTITCEDGTTATVRDGQSGAGPGEGLVANVVVGAPANGTHFVASERIAITIAFTDAAGVPLDYLTDLTSARLYMNGPRDMLKNKTPSALIGASVDRETRPHHYIDLQTTAAANLVVTDGVLTFTTEPVTSEEPGSYQVGIRATREADADRVFELVDVQIQTPTVENEIVGNCSNCHLGAESGQYYFHHVDPGRNAYGSPDIDTQPVKTCRMCHNQEGYAAFAKCDDGTRPPCADGVDELRVPDPIIRRVHGVHNGENLTSRFNIEEDGDFEDYREVAFPADIRNCSTCHLDDSWAQKPSRTACGACHDAVVFATGMIDPPRIGPSCASDPCPADYTCNAGTDTCELATHKPGPQLDDSACGSCHTATAGVGLSPIPDRHQAPTQSPEYNIAVELTPPQNGTHYLDGQAPILTLRFTQTANGAPVDPAAVLTEANFERAQLFVSGPRVGATQPALTTAGSGGSYRYVDLRLRTDPADEDANLSRTATAIEYQLADVAGLDPGTYTVMSRARRVSGTSYSFALSHFQVGTADEQAPTATNCIDCHGDTRMHGYAPFEPDLCKSCHDYERQYGDTPGGVIDGWGGSAASGRSNAGYGAAPLSRRIHGTHFGKYLDKPTDVHASNYAAAIIFPQDVRNCEKCHAQSTRHLDKPQRLACLGCHDTDNAVDHATLMTLDPTPADPWNGDERETCGTCHGGADAIGGDDEFSVEAVHNISNPYRPPYPR